MPSAKGVMETPQDNPPIVSRWKGLNTRIVGVLPFLLVVAGCVLAGGFWFSALVVLAAVLMLKEWDRLTIMEEGKLLRLLGYPLTIIPCASLLWLRSLATINESPSGLMLVVAIIAIIAATDIGAYFTGKRFGKHKLAPAISPNKTWEGLGGGIVCAAIVTMLLHPLPLSTPALFLCGIVLALLAQTGDLLESWVKRRAGVKDSGNLIPGHGGLLDRVDGYLLAAPAYALLVNWAGL